MEPDCHPAGFELRVYLTHLEATGRRLWGNAPETRPTPPQDRIH